MKKYYEEQHGITNFVIHRDAKMYEERGTYYGIRTQRIVTW